MYILLALPFIGTVAIACIASKVARHGKHMSKRELRQLQYLLDKYNSL